MGRQAAVSQWWQSCLGLYNSELSLYRRAALVQFTSPNTDARFSNLSARTCSENLKSSNYFQIFLLHYTKSCTMNEIDGILKKQYREKFILWLWPFSIKYFFFHQDLTRSSQVSKDRYLKRAAFLCLGSVAGMLREEGWRRSREISRQEEIVKTLISQESRSQTRNELKSKKRELEDLKKREHSINTKIKQEIVKVGNLKKKTSENTHSSLNKYWCVLII